MKTHMIINSAKCGRRVARNSQLRGLFWGCGDGAPSHRRHEDLGAEPPALENFAFFFKNNLVLGLN